MSGYSFDSFRGRGDEWDLWHLTPQRDNTQTNESPLHRRVGFATGDVTHRVTTNVAPIVAPIVSPQEPSDPKQKIANTIVGITNLLTENVLLHPMIVLRRQCQVNRKSVAYHLTPFSLIPFVVRLQNKQGMGSLWKGIGSVLITRGMLIATEATIGELTSLPRDLSHSRLSLDAIAQHLLLKGISITIVTPFLCSSCIETVQSCIASESPGVFDCIKEGFARTTHWTLGRSTRLFPIWMLCGPTVVYELTHYVIFSVMRSVSMYIIKQKQTDDGNSEQRHQFNDIICSFWGHITADILLFPLQTVLFRIYLQGTRTIIDNVETSTVIPVISDYDSISDCCMTIIKEEGSSGLFKGFGALIMQYAIHYSILKITKFLIVKVMPALELKL